MPHIFHRSTGAEPPTAVRGEGMYLYDASGKRYLDGSGGAAVSCLGHGDADISRAIRDQVDRLDFAHTGFFTSEAAEALADKLIAHAPGRPREGMLCLRRIGGGRGFAEACPSVLPRNRPAGAAPHHHSQAELSRQHAWGARRWRQPVAAPTLRADADRDIPHFTLLRVSRARRLGKPL